MTGDKRQVNLQQIKIRQRTESTYGRLPRLVKTGPESGTFKEMTIARRSLPYVFRGKLPPISEFHLVPQ